ncbi:MAG: FAD-dependent oxidoreductase [Deltaproteobacteria bacterium]|nr:FAD-dependent oxidoreductase [Deltaproteobacteria bacterium]
MSTMGEEDYDVIVLGGGAGGVPAAIRAAQLGGRVAIIENRDFGGQCMNRGCIPFGHMMLASGIVKSLSLGKEMGLGVHDVTTVDYPALTKRQEELIDFMRQGVVSTLKKNKVELYKGTGTIAGKGTIEINGKNISFQKLILATGATWTMPAFPGAELEEVRNTDALLNLEEVPKRALVFGASPWLIEIAQFLARFGSQVILATPEDSILSSESRAIISRLRKVLRGDGIAIKTEAAIGRAERKNQGLTVELSAKDGTETVALDTLLTLERVPALKGIGLSSINLEEESPFLAVNDRMETSVQGIYAIGDLTAPSEDHYSHRAAQTGIVAAENAMGKTVSVNPRTLTRVIFTQPEVASVGLSAKEARDHGYETVVGSAPLSMNPFGMILAENEGLIEVVADKRYGEILGIRMIGTAASEMAGQAVLAIQMEATLEDLDKTPFPHPTLSESLAEAARDALGKPIYLP